jgi:hypothetical protein
MDKLDTTLQDARTLLKSAQNHPADDNGPGIAAGLTAGLAGAIESAADLAALDAAYSDLESCLPYRPFSQQGQLPEKQA